MGKASGGALAAAAAELGPPVDVPEEEPARRPLTAEERKANVQRVVDVERELGRMQTALGEHLLSGAGLYARLHELREELRKVLGLDELGRMAPFYEAAVKRHEEQHHGDDDGTEAQGAAAEHGGGEGGGAPVEGVPADQAERAGRKPGRARA